MRETGPVAKVFENQQVGLEGQNDTKPYIPTARTLLGQLKTRMEAGEVKVGRMVRDLEDGTRIIVSSIMGQDKIQIIAPNEPTPERAEPEYPIPVPTFENPPVPTPPLEIDAKMAAACGYVSGDVGTTWACVWKTLDAEPTLICDGGVANAISENGQVVVGYYHPSGTPVASGGGMPFRWTTETGVMDIPDMDPDSPNGQATAVSADGGVVVGYGKRSGGANSGWVWTPDGGTQDLPDEGLGAHPTCLSPNGRWAAGTVGTPLYGPTPQTSINGRVCIWRCDENGNWTHTLPSRPGGSSEEQRLQGPPRGPRPDSYFAVNITDEGVAIFVDDHLTGFSVAQIDNYQIYHESVMPFIPEYGEQAIPGKDYVYPDVWYGTHLPPDNRVYRYTGGVAQLMSQSQARAASDDIEVIVGAENYGNFISRQQFDWNIGHHVYNSAGGHATDHYTWRFALSPWYDISLGATYARSWWWSERSGKQYLEPRNSLPEDISEDGMVIVGGITGSMSANALADGVRLPCYWWRNRDVQAVHMSTGGFGSGWCMSVARPRTPKAENGGAPPIIPG